MTRTLEEVVIMPQKSNRKGRVGPPNLFVQQFWFPTKIGESG